MADNRWDIFISYAHVNDERVPGVDEGWVTTFVQGLKTYLGREMGRRDAFTLWMDYELRGNAAVTPEIHKALSAARTLVLFLSEAYMKSTWCREELARFKERVGVESGRIFVVDVSPLREEADPLPDLRQYRFWVEDSTGQPRTLGDPRPDPTQRGYYTGLEDLSRDLAATLADLPRKDTTDDFTVFVHGGEDDLPLVRDTAARLEKQGVSCTLPLSALSSFDPQRTSASEVSQDLRSNLERSDALLLVYDQGPVAQVRRFVTEFRKSKAEEHARAGSIAVCQRHEDPMALGIAAPDLEIFVTPEPRSKSCAEQFVQALKP